MSLWYSSILLSSCVTLTIFLWIYSSQHLRTRLKRFVHIQIRRRILDPSVRGSDRDAFVTYYRTFLCSFQLTNNNLLRSILGRNHRCEFYVDRSIGKDFTIDEFREKVPLTNYEAYRSYVDRMVKNGEENLLSAEKNIYYATSSGTTANIKFLPWTLTGAMNIRQVFPCGNALVWRSLPSSLFPSASQKAFLMTIAKRCDRFPTSQDGTPIGPVSQFSSAVPMNAVLRLVLTSMIAVPNDLIEDILDFETSCFVQHVFALAQADLYSYTTTFAPTLLHSIEMIKHYFPEISECIATGSFDGSSLIQKTIDDRQVQQRLNDRLKELLDQYGGDLYQSQRAEQIRRECVKEDQSALFQRLWPKLIFVSAAIGGSFASYKEEVKFYCGENLRLIHMMPYAASEGFFGCSASVDTDEYLLLPTLAFFEFIREEDVDQPQPKTLLMSELEPGHSYELVCTTEAGLVRYRMGDIGRCTRFMQRADDLVPLPAEPTVVPQIPLISIAYRIGTLLSVFGEKISEQQIFIAIHQTIEHWKQQGLPLDLVDFTSYPKLNVFPVRYVIFLELNREDQDEAFAEKFTNHLEEELCRSNEYYQVNRERKKLDHLVSVLVRRGTFASFAHGILLNDRVSAIQVNPHGLLRKDEHIRYFYDQSIFKAE